jgi:hypothetical protein
MTSQDWSSLSAAAAAGGTNYLESLAQEQQTMLQGIPDAGGSTGPGGLPGTSTASGVGLDAITAVQNEFPNLAWLLSIPELAPMIVSWAQQNLSPTQAEAQFESTPWYRTHSDSVRQWINDVNTDPAKAQQELNAQEASIFATISQLGVGAIPQEVTWLAQQSLAFGWTDQQIKQAIATGTHYNAQGIAYLSVGGMTGGPSTVTGTLQANIDSINAEAAKYLIPISASTAQSFATALAGGTMDQSGVTAYMQQQATSLYPSIAGAIKAGITPADYVTPYKEVAAQLLGVNPNSIDMMKPQYQRALTAPGPNGVPTAMSLYDFQNMIMKDPQYNYMNSVNAKDRSSSIAAGLAEMFGKAPSGPAGSTAFSSAGAPRIAGVPIT